MSTSVRSANKSEIPAVAALLGSAFALDPSFRRILGERGREESEAELTTLSVTLIRHHYFDSGEVDVAVGNSGQILGAALWDRPGSTLGFKAKAAAAPQVVRLMGRRLAKEILTAVRVGSYHPKFPHWYLFVIGAAPEAQGKGVGTALLARGLERAGDDAAYLEATTPASARLYQRMGFVPLGANPVPTPGQQPELGMWRPGAMPNS
ncbi:GNAT family N-acetyltransferase [Corynebacterium sanguinis]